MKHPFPSRVLAAFLAVIMVFSMFPAVARAADTDTYNKVEITNASDITAGTYLIYGTSSGTLDDGVTSGAFMSTANSTETRLMSASLTIANGAVSTDDTNSVWKLIATEGGFYVQNVGNGKYLYYGDSSGNSIYQTEDLTEAGVWAVTANGSAWTLQEVASQRQLSCNRFGSSGSYYLGFAAYASTSSTKRELEFYKLSDGSSETPDPGETENPDQPEDPEEPVTATLVDAVTDGARVYIYHAASQTAMTATVSGKKLAAASAVVTDDTLTVTDEMAELTVSVDDSGYYTFLSADGQYLTSGATGNALSFETEASDYSLWSLEEAEDGYYIKNVNASYNGNAQALEYYSGYTTYGFKEDAAYLFQFYAQPAQGQFVSELTDGMQVVIYNPSNSVALSSQLFYKDDGTENGMVATEVTLADDDTLSGFTSAELWTVGVVQEEDAVSYTFTSADGKVLSALRTNVSMDGEYTGWTLELIDGTSDTFFVKNTYSTYLEYYTSQTRWSCYYNPSVGMYDIRFYATGSGTVSNTVAAPKAVPAAGVVESGTEISFTCATEGASILYHTGDGQWTAYTDPLTITEDTTFTVKAVKEGMDDSKEVTFAYTIYVAPELGENQATLVTDVSELNSGDQILIVAQKYDYAMGTTQKSNNRDQAPVVKAYDKVSYDEYAQILTLESGSEADTFAFYTVNGDEQGYLYCPTDSGNLLRTQEGKDENASFSITIDENGLATIQAQNDKKASIIQYNTVGIFSCYGGTQNAVQIYKLDGVEKPGLPEQGDTVVIYNLSAKGVLSGQDDNTDSPSINGVGAVIQNGKADCESGALLFTVERNGDYYRFYNDSFGYLCSNGTGNNAFYSTEASEDADWTLAEYNGGYSLESRTAKYNDKYSQYLEYYSASYKTYSMYNVTDKDIYTFYFYPCANDKITDGVVNTPQAVFGTLAAAYAGQDYFLHFTVSALFGVKELKVTLAGVELDVTESGGEYTATIPASMISGDVLTVTVTGLDNKDVEIHSSVDIEVRDEPVISNLSPASNAQTRDDKRPTISADIANAGDDPTITMTVNGEEVKFTYENGTVSYTPDADMEDGRVSVTITVARSDGKETTKSWNFVVGETQYQLYFGQLHSHTGEYSDGSGTLADALDYIASLPDSANVDFVAFTDHSNYFDTTAAANPEAALYDMSLASTYSQEKWESYKSAVEEFNASQSDIVAIAGFEMTWSGGPGHINTFDTPGIVSRNNTTLNSKTADAGMKAYYALLTQTEGVDSISQFNHPGSTFGTFSDFSYYDALIDSRIYLVEVGNGEGAIGAGGYYPSYEYYTMALDKGWHVAPTNNQDNHKGKWGNANDARDVILADELTEESIYEAIRAYRVYATEDKNLEIGYYVNDLPMGTIIENVPETLSFDITFSDPDETDSIAKVELIVNSGKTAYTWDDAEILATGHVTVDLAPEYSYYYLRITEADGDLAVTAPVWVGESLKLGISSVECGTDTPVTDEELTITTTLFNSESSDARVKSITYTTAGSQVLGVDTTGYTLPASSTMTIDWTYVPTDAKVMTITATVVVELESKEYTFSMAVELDVMDADSLVYIGIDASHYNEYVSGNYKDSMGNFSALAAEYSVRTVTLNTSEDLIAACGNEKYKAIILTAPSRRLEAAQTELLTYTDDELAAIVAFNNNGGTVILAGWSDNYENYPSVFGENNQDLPAEKHMAATQNAVLEALGSSLRISDDATYDDVRSAADGVEKWRLYFSAYGDSFLTDGVIFDADNPYSNLYTELFSHYGGASIYAVDSTGAATDTLPDTVSAVVYAHESTYSVDVDGDGLGGSTIPTYTYSDGTSRLLAMATEQQEGKGLIVVSGAAFMSDFEVQATVDSGSENNYSNYRICENLLKAINPATITSIAEVQQQTETGYKYTIEGVVTSNASGYDKDTAFFDCIYVQDDTAGICCFPVAGEYQIGDVVRITGTTDFYQGEMELQVTSIERIDQGQSVEPTAITAEQLNSRAFEGSLVTVRGVVSKVTYANGIVESIYFGDESGNTGRIFIDGYITSTKEIAGLKVGTIVEATGLASYDDTYAIAHDSYVRLRVRDRDDVSCSRQQFVDVPEGAYYYDDVYYLADNGIICGTAPEYFSPQQELTRAQMVAILYRVAGCPDYTQESTYSDVTSGWYYDAVAWATENGIAAGYQGGYFAPNQAVTRQEMAAFLYRFANYCGEDVTADVTVLDSYTDGSSVSGYARQAVAWCVTGELVVGTSDSTLSPRETALRCQAAAVIARYCQR